MKNIDLLRTLCIVFVVACLSCGENGKNYNSYDDFIEAQEADSFVFLGRFGESWPAEVVEVKTAMNEISFELKDGTKHRYPGYDGYELKMVRLIAKNDHETVIVLRSKEKK
jgi:hypothetical protein